MKKAAMNQRFWGSILIQLREHMSCYVRMQGVVGKRLKIELYTMHARCIAIAYGHQCQVVI